MLPEEVDDEIRQAGGAPATLVPLNLREFDKIDLLGAQFFERFGRLDVLVGNAGVLGQLSPVGHVPPKVLQEVMDVNVTANWRLIRSKRWQSPLMAKSRPPAARIRLPLSPQQRTFRGPRWTSAFDPGCVKTPMSRPSAQQLNPEGNVDESLLRRRPNS